jgi:hypothetical protein
MIPFFEQTWLLWWVIAVIAILRWFHLLSKGTELDGEESLAKEEQSHIVPALPLQRR